MEKVQKSGAIIALILIILLQLIFKIYIDYHKEDYFIDELYSYGLMNYKQAFIFEEPTFVNNWHNKEYFDDYLIISKDEAKNFSSVYKNQMEDFHPPFYYLLLRIASSFSIGTFTKWTGLILNLVIFVFCAIFVYLIGKLLFKNKKYALLLVAFYGFSKFSMENTLFIRMYQLLELQMLLLTQWILKNYYKKELKLKKILTFIFLVVLGTLTHYYYVIFLLGISIVIIAKYIRKKQFKNLSKFIGAFIIAQLLICLIFPKYLDQLSSNAERSTGETMSFADKLQLYAGRAKEYMEVLNTNMFNISFTYILIAIIVIAGILLIINLIKNPNKKIRLKCNKRINVILVPTIFFWLIISLTSPYIDVRYILPIFVFILIETMYILKKELQMLIKNKKIVLILMVLLCICFVNPFWGNRELKYQYSSNKEKFENLEKYKDIPCIYMYVPATVLHNDFVANLNYVRQFENVYILDKTQFSIERLENELKEVDTLKGIIIIDNAFEIDMKANNIIMKMKEFKYCKKIETITTERTIYDNIYWIY